MALGAPDLEDAICVLFDQRNAMSFVLHQNHLSFSAVVFWLLLVSLFSRYDSQT